MKSRFHHGEKIYEISLGGYALSGAYGKKDPQQFIGIVKGAYERGVNFFDVADIYGPAEEILGRAVASFRQKVWLATKVGWSSQGKPDCSPEHIRSSCEQSLKNLHTDYIDLYQIHIDDADTPTEATVGALEALNAAGKIRHYGIGHVPPDRLEAYFTLGHLFSEMTEFSAVARSARRRVLPTCQAHQVGVIAFSVTGRGLLTGKIVVGHVFKQGDLRLMDPLFQRERFASGLRIAEYFRILGEKYGKTSTQAAIAWVHAQPGILCALIGPSTLPHLEENLGASGWAIAPNDLDELEKIFEIEEARLGEEQKQSIRAILSQDLEPERAFTDLLYAIETLVEIGIASEDQVMPTLGKLMGARKLSQVDLEEALTSIQVDLRNKLL
jgi:aryl-alcohol dehydrogenase-like predicted oxidoreductase